MGVLMGCRFDHEGLYERLPQPQVDRLLKLIHQHGEAAVLAVLANQPPKGGF
jgi:hypothetical protein